MKITRIDRLAGAAAGRERDAQPTPAPPLSAGWPGPAWFAFLGIYLLLYVSWLIWSRIPFNQGLVGQVILLPINAAAAALAWQASRSSVGRTGLRWPGG